MGHYCTEHQTIFFKKGKMRGYAHPIGDTGEWCNEPEEGGDEIPEKVKQEQQVDVNTKNRSYALSYAKDIAVARIMMGGEMSTGKILAIAEQFESYLDNGVTVEKREP